jgi:F-type H+-transporting ATPase subunit delta
VSKTRIGNPGTLVDAAVARLLRLCYSGPDFKKSGTFIIKGFPLPQIENEPVTTSGNALARRYADALFELARDESQLDAVAGDLRRIKNLVRENAEFKRLAGHPRLRRAELVEAMRQMAAAAGFHTITGNFLMLTAQNRRLPYLGAMTNAFLKSLAARRGEMMAEVRVARALTEAQRERLAAQLRDLAASSKIQLAVTEDPALLGGMTVKLGSQLIDVSVRTKLARLERQLKSQEEAG